MCIDAINSGSDTSAIHLLWPDCLVRMRSMAHSQQLRNYGPTANSRHRDCRSRHRRVHQKRRTGYSQRQGNHRMILTHKLATAFATPDQRVATLKTRLTANQQSQKHAVPRCRCASKKRKSRLNATSSEKPKNAKMCDILQYIDI